MTTATADRAGSPVRGARRSREAPLWLGLGAVALLAALAVPTYPNYDSYFSLDWGRELLGGALPHTQAYAAPTQHPLFVLLCALLDLVFGGWADRALVLVCVASFVVLVWAVWRVGCACFGLWPGVLAALFCGSSFAFLLYAVRAYVDVPFLALVLVAAALEAERPRRGVPVAAVLALAGLLRPEAWVLAGLYWLWCGWRRVDLLALAAVSPVLWAGADVALTGDPLYSLHATSALADALGRERGIAHVPRSFVSFLADTARLPVFLAGLLGAALAWWQRARLRALHVPLALFAAGTITFVATGVAGLSILPRYLTVPAVALCVLAGWAVAGFTELPAGRERTWWARAAIGALAVGVLFLVVKAGSFVTLARELRFIDRTHRDVAAVARDPLLGRCAPVTLPTYRLIPDLRFELDARESRVRARSQLGARARGVAVYVTGEEKAIKRFGRAAGVANRFDADPPRGGVQHGFLRAVPRC